MIQLFFRFYMASTAEDRTVKLWDLRKLRVIQTVNLENHAECLSFDYSGKYLAVGGDDIRYRLTMQFSKRSHSVIPFLGSLASLISCWNQ